MKANELDKALHLEVLKDLNEKVKNSYNFENFGLNMKRYIKEESEFINKDEELGIGFNDKRIKIYYRNKYDNGKILINNNDGIPNIEFDVIKTTIFSENKMYDKYSKDEQIEKAKKDNEIFLNKKYDCDEVKHGWRKGEGVFSHCIKNYGSFILSSYDGRKTTKKVREIFNQMN